ncbi:glycosyl transferase [Vulcanisaeta souniana JCM 11219]|uniref:Glycosyl transferase n=1 Tax=Vulcanisaeta souniana JCM 11219 TaxID=1293586 RepID=A0A830EF41_9CREN|nr:glycosyl transferase [Vulcanisaeta souniana JCM 11219]GGI76739.1 glycosyl transferase [Vulcanisaeta souniana JCM 11219]
MREVGVVVKPIVGVIMYQTSYSKGQELVAQRMVKWFLRLGYEAYLITSVYHDGNEVVKRRAVETSLEGYIFQEKDNVIGLPTIRVDSYMAKWPPRRIMFKNFIDVLRRISDNFGINSLITHSTLWNGPEETSKYVMWRRMLTTLGLEGSGVFFGHMSHYQPPDPTRYDIVERSYRLAWNHVAFPEVFKAANLVLCVTPLEGEEMIRMGARPEQIYVFPGGIDDDEVADLSVVDSSDFRVKYRIPDDVKIVAYLGTVEERKNPLAVVRVARMLRHRRDVHFVIAGKPGDQWDEVVNEARDLSNVTLTGELSIEDKKKLIKEAYVNIIMSKMEALGLTQLEFMYGGVPVITSAVYGQKWVVRNGVDGIHVNGPDDVEGAAKAVERLLDNPEERDRMGRNARERASQLLMSKLIKELAVKIEEYLR